MYTIYLAGAINGKSYEEATQWRDRVGNELTLCGYRVFDPMRYKACLKGNGSISDANTGLDPTHILSRDLIDVGDSDVVFANMEGLGELPMIGTLMELGMALTQGAWVVLFNLPGKFHAHPFFYKFEIARNEEEAIAKLRGHFEF